MSIGRWCVLCCDNIDVAEFEHGCPSSNGGAHKPIGHGINIDRIARDLPSNQRADRAARMAKKKGKMQSH